MTMQLIYLHGFQSNPQSHKAQQLRGACQKQHIALHVPDLNAAPEQVMRHVSHLIEKATLPTALVGSSLGGFYAHILAAKYAVPAVLINPAMQPWLLFQTLFNVAHLPYQVTQNWLLDAEQLQHLAQMALPQHPHAKQLLIWLQSGDEVLDYGEAERYYRQAQHAALVIREQGGNHAMDNFAQKIPILLHFLSAALQAHKG